MSKALSKIRLIDDSDFLKAKRLEKFQMVFLEPRLEQLLTDQEFEHLERVRQAFALVWDEFSQTQAIRILRAEVPGCDRFEVAKQLYNDMTEMYGPVMRRNKDLARAQLVERLWKLGEKLELDEDWTAAAEVYEKAGKFEGLDKHDGVDFDPADVDLPEITITNDPRYINAEYEDVTDNPEDEDEEESLL